jgi:hypothetical protein
MDGAGGLAADLGLGRPLWRRMVIDAIRSDPD